MLDQLATAATSDILVLKVSSQAHSVASHQSSAKSTLVDANMTLTALAHHSEIAQSTNRQDLLTAHAMRAMTNHTAESVRLITQAGLSVCTA